jgi:hypothetical protein
MKKYATSCHLSEKFAFNLDLKEFDIHKKAEDGQQLIKFIWVPFRGESNAMISSIRHINIQNIF